MVRFGVLQGIINEYAYYVKFGIRGEVFAKY